MPKPAVKQRSRQKSNPFEKNSRNRADGDIEMTDSAEGVRGKDATEEKLERLLFGDDEGFVGALKNQKERGLVALSTKSDEDSEAEDSEEGEGNDEDLDNIDDADLFFLDSGAGPVSAELPDSDATSSSGESEAEEVGMPALWYDSDDDRMAISLSSQGRLRKLRVTESEDIISGREYIRRLRRQFLQLHPVPEWADPAANQPQRGDDDSDRAEDMDTDDEELLSTQPLAKLLQGTTDLTNLEEKLSNGKRKLRQEMVDIQRLKDVCKDQPSSIDSLMFHPHYPLLLSSGPAATLFLHHIAPSAPAPNPLLTSLHIRRTPIHTSAFGPPSGNKIFASGRRRYFHIWDLDTGKVDKVNGSADRKEEQKSMERFKLSPCGRYVGLVGSSRKGGGLINVLDSTTAQWVAQVRVDGRGGVADFAWWSDGEGMTVVSKNGEVSEWDGRLNRVVARWMDAGAVGTTVLALGGRSGRAQLGGDRWVAIGSSSGVVNVYDRREWAAAYSSSNADDAASAIPRHPEPVRALDQLTTPISHVVFAPDGQFFVMASRWKRDALRIVHLPSCTVYRNWPTSNTPLGRISAVAVSPNSEQLAVANEQGRIRLWEILG